MEFDLEAQETCCICLDVLKKNIHVTKCRHKYHKKCINEYLQYNEVSKCPLCGRIIEQSYIFEKYRALVYCFCMQIMVFAIIIIFMLTSLIE